MRLTRRQTALGLSAALAAGAATSAAAAADRRLAAIERSHGGRLGVFALDTGSGRILTWRADERFQMCSTFKLLAVAAVLTRVDAGRERLDRRIPYGAKDLQETSPVTRAHLAEGGLSLGVLCQAAIQVSDNTAANLLMASLGGPPGVTAFARRLGDPVTRQDDWEPVANRPAGERNTTTPRAMAGCARAILLGRALKPASRDRVEAWMVAATPGLQRLRAGLPAGWRAGDKAGTSPVETNDIALIRPPGRAPLVAAAYYARPDGMDGPAAEAVLRDVGAALAGWIAQV